MELLGGVHNPTRPFGKSLVVGYMLEHKMRSELREGVMNEAVLAFCREISAGFSSSPTLSELNTRLCPQRVRWKEIAACAACGSSSIKAFATLRDISYDRCQKCGFTFANPVPPNDVLSEFYNSPFYNNYRKLESNRIQSEPYFSISAYTDLRRLASWLEEERPAYILDVGCGPGSFLALLRDEFDFESVEGIEINSQSKNIAEQNYGLRLVSDVSELRYKHYDLIILHEVIEHVPHPDEFLEFVHSFVKPGGRLLLTTPSVRNLPARFFPSHCGHYVGPNHISMFTEEALSELLSRFQFRIERLEVDICAHILGNFILSLVYDLDFLSPRSDDDSNDLLFVPTRIGYSLGLIPTRSPGRLGRALQRLDRLAASVIRKGLSIQHSDHLYVLARKAEAVTETCNK
jgi:2-polyprenyl-3-methyl-5-hydroxy-6-metoxy-1,4-benzoquinol methylase